MSVIKLQRGARRTPCCISSYELFAFPCITLTSHRARALHLRGQVVSIVIMCYLFFVVDFVESADTVGNYKNLIVGDNEKTTFNILSVEDVS
jgi:hypothetical protein